MIYQVHQQDAELRGIAIGEERGEKRGIAIGEERGEKRNMVKTAMGMLRENLPIEMISRITGLSISEINKLKAAVLSSIKRKLVQRQDKKSVVRQ